MSRAHRQFVEQQKRLEKYGSGAAPKASRSGAVPGDPELERALKLSKAYDSDADLERVLEMSKSYDLEAGSGDPELERALKMSESYVPSYGSGAGSADAKLQRELSELSLSDKPSRPSTFFSEADSDSDMEKALKESLEMDEDERKAIEESIQLQLQNIDKEKQRTLDQIEANETDIEKQIKSLKSILKLPLIAKERIGATEELANQTKLLKESKTAKEAVTAQAEILKAEIRGTSGAAAAPAAYTPRLLFPIPRKPMFPDETTREQPICTKIIGKDGTLTDYLLKFKGLQRCKATGNGSCMYNSVSQLLHGTETYAQHYKNIAIWYLATHKDKMPQLQDIEKEAPKAIFKNGFPVLDASGKPKYTKSVLYSSVDEYLFDISQPFKWGGEIELSAIVKAINEERPGRFLCATIWSQQNYNLAKENKNHLLRPDPRNPQTEELFKMQYGDGSQDPSRGFYRRCDNPEINLYYNGVHYDALFPVGALSSRK
jgi:hypothetical protein